MYVCIKMAARYVLLLFNLSGNNKLKFARFFFDWLIDHSVSLMLARHFTLLNLTILSISLITHQLTLNLFWAIKIDKRTPIWTLSSIQKSSPHFHPSVEHCVSICISPHTGLVASWLASLYQRATWWGYESQTREHELGCAFPCRHTLSGRWGRNSGDKGGGEEVCCKSREITGSLAPWNVLK